MTFTDVTAGLYELYVEIASMGFAYPTADNKDYVDVNLVAAASAVTSSYAGGNGLVITGFGFDATTVITVCGQPCPIENTATDVTHTQVTCQTPQIVSASTNTAYSLA